MNDKPLRPLLAAKFNEGDLEPQLAQLSYPLIASPKLDGIRTLIHPEMGAVTRTLKQIPNKDVWAFFKEHLHALKYLDGELVVGEPQEAGLFNQTQSAVMSFGGSPNFTFWVFDAFDHCDLGYVSRLSYSGDQVRTFQRETNIARIGVLEHKVVGNHQEVLAYEEECLARGFEGIMLRHPHGPYKYGRSTLKAQTLIKLKRMEDAEAVVIGFEPLSRNTNPKEADLLGLSKRSSHKAGKVVDELLGKLCVRSDRWGDFSIGSGFDVATREQIWTNQEAYLNRTVSFKYQACGIKSKPRFPIFKGFRLD